MSVSDQRSRLEELRPLTDRIRAVVLRGLVHLSDDSGPVRTLQIETLPDEVDDGVEQLEPYGLAGRPMDPDASGSAELVALAPGSDEESTIVVLVMDRRYRPANIDKGEVRLYNHRGQAISLKSDRLIVDTVGSDPIELGAGATKGVGRLDDLVAVDSASDPAFRAWQQQVDVAIGVMAAQFNAPPAPMISLGPGSVVPSVSPATVTGKIATASSKVRAVD